MTSSSRLREIADGAAHDLFARAVGIDVGGIEEIDAQRRARADERPARLFIQRPGVRAALRYAVAHAAQADPRYLQAGIAKPYSLHSLPSLPSSSRWRLARIPTLLPVLRSRREAILHC